MPPPAPAPILLGRLPCSYIILVIGTQQPQSKKDILGICFIIFPLSIPLAARFLAQFKNSGRNCYRSLSSISSQSSQCHINHNAPWKLLSCSNIIIITIIRHGNLRIKCKMYYLTEPLTVHNNVSRSTVRQGAVCTGVMCMVYIA